LDAFEQITLNFKYGIDSSFDALVASEGELEKALKYLDQQQNKKP